MIDFKKNNMVIVSLISLLKRNFVLLMEEYLLKIIVIQACKVKENQLSITF